MSVYFYLLCCLKYTIGFYLQPIVHKHVRTQCLVKKTLCLAFVWPCLVYFCNCLCINQLRYFLFLAGRERVLLLCEPVVGGRGKK